MHNIWWITDDGTELECAMCKNYVEGSRMKTICLACRHEYGAHTDADVEDMDYQKADLFDPTDKAIENDAIRQAVEQDE